VFDQIDRSHNGTVDFQEFREGLQESALTDEELTQIFESIVSTHNNNFMLLKSDMHAAIMVRSGV